MELEDLLIEYIRSKDPFYSTKKGARTSKRAARALREVLRDFDEDTEAPRRRRSGRTRSGAQRSLTGRLSKPKRRPTKANARYSRCFKKLKPKYMKKNGGWKKDGFARCVRAAHRCARRAN